MSPVVPRGHEDCGPRYLRVTGILAHPHTIRSGSGIVLEAIKIITRRIIRGVQIRGTDLLMMRSRVMFSEIISLVQCALLPVYMELALAYSVTNPVKAHIDRLGTFLFHGVVCDSGGCAIVCDDRGRRLWVAKFRQTDA